MPLKEIRRSMKRRYLELFIVGMIRSPAQIGDLLGMVRQRDAEYGTNPVVSHVLRLGRFPWEVSCHERVVALSQLPLAEAAIQLQKAQLS